jgi:hypothetical protein
MLKFIGDLVAWVRRGDLERKLQIAEAQRNWEELRLRMEREPTLEPDTGVKK